MGTVQSFAELASRFNQAAGAMEKAKTAAVTRGGTIIRDAEAATGGRMRNLGKSGATLTARMRVSSEGAYITPTPIGAWSIKEFGARPHIITPRGGFGGGRSFGSRKRRALGHRLGARIGAGDRRAVLHIPGIGYRKFVNHPGSRARPSKNAAVDAALPGVWRAMQTTYHDALASAFG